MKALENEHSWRKARQMAEARRPLRPGPWIALAALLVLGFLLVGCTSAQYRDTSVEMRTNGPVDLNRYTGLWYEIARYPNSFEEGCVGVTAEYSLKDDGSIKVLNTCREGTLDGPVSTAEGRATAENADQDKLLVGFVSWLPFARGDYWILDTDYEISVIGTPSGSVGWILARTPTLPDDKLQQAIDVLRGNGYDPAALMMIKQTP